MIGMHVLEAIELMVAGGTIGGLGVISLGIKRDDRRGRFPANTNDLIARAARRATRVGTRNPDPARDGRRHRRDTLPV